MVIMYIKGRAQHRGRSEYILSLLQRSNSHSASLILSLCVFVCWFCQTLLGKTGYPGTSAYLPVEGNSWCMSRLMLHCRFIYFVQGGGLLAASQKLPPRTICFSTCFCREPRKAERPSVGEDSYRLLGRQVHPRISIRFQSDNLRDHFSSQGEGVAKRVSHIPHAEHKARGKEVTFPASYQGFAILELGCYSASFPGSAPLSSLAMLFMGKLMMVPGRRGKSL